VANGVTKGHAADGQKEKCWWTKGASSSQVWPMFLDGPGPVWLCPGELKALSVIACGDSAIGITSGEGTQNKDTGKVTPTDLPPAALELLRGKVVAIPPDDDPVGQAWGEHVAKQVTDVCAEVRIVRLPLDKAAGVKDVADYIVGLQGDGKATDEIRATLSHFFELAPVVTNKWTGTSLGEIWQNPRTWAPVTYVSTGLRWFDARLCGGFRTRGVSLLAAKPKQGKTQLAVTCALNAAKAGIPTAYFSAELGADDVSKLIMAQLADIPRKPLDEGRLTGQWGEQFQRVQSEFGRLPLKILDDAQWPGGLTREVFTGLVADGCKRFGWRAVFLDYLGKMAPSPDDAPNAYDTDIKHSSALVMAARKNDIALVVVVSLRKGTEKRTIENMSTDDVLGAARLGYDAINILAVGRKFGGKDSGLIRVRPLDMRFAPCGENSPTIDLRWKPSTGAIVDGDWDEPGEADAPDGDYDGDEEARIYKDAKGNDEEGGGVPF